MCIVCSLFPSIHLWMVTRFLLLSTFFHKILPLLASFLLNTTFNQQVAFVASFLSNLFYKQRKTTSTLLNQSLFYTRQFLCQEKKYALFKNSLLPSSHNRCFETFEKRSLSPNFCVRLKIQSSKYSVYSCG